MRRHAQAMQACASSRRALQKSIANSMELHLIYFGAIHFRNPLGEVIKPVANLFKSSIGYQSWQSENKYGSIRNVHDIGPKFLRWDRYRAFK